MTTKLEKLLDLKKMNLRYKIFINIAFMLNIVLTLCIIIFELPLLKIIFATLLFIVFNAFIMLSRVLHNSNTK